jgi:hypothetical protein
MYLKWFLAGTIVAAFLTGCTKDSSSPVAATSAPLLVSPADGQTNVRLDAGIILRFAEPVDRAVVERDLHLLSERAMADSLCPTSTIMEHGNMMSAMGDSSKMRHLDQNHSTSGRFYWNSDSTLCTFKPDSLMASNMQYMIHLGFGMMEMMQNRLGEMRGMSGHGSGMMSGDMMLHFWTLDTTQTGSGHDSHHK